MARPSLKVNALSNWVSLAVNIIIGFALTPFIIRSLGKTGYGIWTLVCSFVGYYGLLSLGVGSAINRYVARYSAQKDQKALSQFTSTAMAMFSMTGALAIAISFLCGGVLADFFNVAPAERASFVKLVWIVGVTAGIGFPSSVLIAVVVAREHYVAKNIVVVSQELLRAGLTVACVNAGWGLLGVGLAPLAATIYTVICTGVLFRMYAGDIQLRVAYVNMKTLGALLVYGGVTTIIVIADIMRVNLDSLVIGKWVNVDAVGVYGVAALVIRYMAKIVNSAMKVLIPRFTHLDSSDSRDELRVLFLRSSRVAGFFSFGLSLSAIVFGPRFILVWAGQDYGGAVPVLIVLATAYPFSLSQSPALSLMYAMNKHHYYALCTVLEAVANVFLSILLVKRYGIVGVAVGTAIPMIIVKCWVTPIYISRISGLSVWGYLQCFGLPFVLASLFYLVFYLCGLNTFLLDCHLSVYFATLAVFGVAYLAVFLLSYFKWMIRSGSL